MSTAVELLRKSGTVPAITRKKDILARIVQPEFWDNVSIVVLENVRIEIRNLTRLLENSGRSIFYTNFTDEITAPVTIQDFS